jgi:hypothetical protein
VRKRSVRKRAAVQRGLEVMKLKNLHYKKPLQETVDEDTAGWKRLNWCCDDL